MSVKSQQVTKPDTGKRVQASRPLTAHVRGFAGNHTMLRKLHAREKSERLQGTAQLKLAGNEAGNRYEQEADRMADQVMGTPESHVRRQARGRKGSISAPRNIDEMLSSGRSLDAPTRAFMEHGFGANFRNVRVHTDAKATESAQALHARAFTLGNQVVFAEGEYRPTNPEGQRLIAHELSHVLQQRSGLSRGVQLQPDDEPPGGDLLLTEDQRERYRIEVASRIGDVARKWSLAISLTYTNEKTKPDEVLWGFVFEALFTFVGGLIGRALARNLGAKTLAFFTEDSARLKELGLTETADEFSKIMAERVEKGFDRVQEALVEGGKVWGAEHTKRPTQSDDANTIAATMSDTVGRWAQSLREQYIVEGAANAEDDAKLIGALEAFDEQYHPQATYNEKVAEAWRRYHDKLIPVLSAKRGLETREGLRYRGETLGAGIRDLYQLRVAEIVYPAYAELRLAVVREYIDERGDPIGDYAFDEWVAPDFVDVLEDAEDAWIAKKQLPVDTLINPTEPELFDWLQSDIGHRGMGH